MSVPTHRFTLSPAIGGLLDGLGREGFHETLRSAADSRWSRFVTDHARVIEMERVRLAAAGYEGDVSTKMFRSARYYRARRDADAASAAERGVDTALVQRRAYVATPADLIVLMDGHVRVHCFGAEAVSPARGWSAFQEEHPHALALGIQALTGTERLTLPDAREKVKKAYKNRQYLQRRQRQRAARRAMVLAEIEESDRVLGGTEARADGERN